MNSQWKLVPVEPTQSILDAMTTERKKGNGVLQMWFEAMAAAPAPPEAHEAACVHEWTDDGEFLLVCTKCGTQENHDPKWRDMQSAPKDGTLLRLLVSFDEHSTEDAGEAPTIGANNFDNDGDDAWRFAGWCWSHDHFTQGVGTPVGWLPMIEASASTAELDRVTAERDALQQRLNAADQRIDELERDKARLDALDSNCWDVRFNSSPNGDAGDSSINIEVVGHWMDQPFERVIGENYSENLRAAIDQAMTAPAYPPARPEYPEPESTKDDDWRMNPCKQGHRDVGAAGGVAACNQCGEKVEAATTQEAFEQWNATHQPAIEKPDSPFTEQFIEDHLGKNSI